MDDPTRVIEASQEHDDKDKREERREKREEGREKREERREKREERREKREEGREKREEVPREAARGPQMRPQEVPKEVPRGLLASWRPDRVRGRDGEAKGRPQKKHPRATESLFPKSFENQRVLRNWSPARIPAFLQGPVTTSIEGKTRSKKSF